MTGELGEKAQITITCPKWLASAVEQEANRRMMSKTAWIREAIIEHLPNAVSAPEIRTVVRQDGPQVGQENETP